MIAGQNRLYIDSNLIIYSVEFPEKLRVSGVAAAELRQNFTCFTSRLALLECLVVPLRKKDQRLVQTYRSLLLDSSFQTIPIHDEILDIAADIRATCNFSLPDAIHIATAKFVNCDAILSNDREWQKFSEIPIYDFDQFIAELA